MSGRPTAFGLIRFKRNRRNQTAACVVVEAAGASCPQGHRVVQGHKLRLMDADGLCSVRKGCGNYFSFSAVFL